MIVNIKDSLKLIGIIIVSFCAVFVCTFMLNYYLDVKDTALSLTSESAIALYNAQISTAKLCCAVSGGCLSLIAAIMLIFYIKNYIDTRAVQLGILKAMGWSERKLAVRFWIFGLSFFAGASIGFAGAFAVMPVIYKGMSGDELPQIAIHFHFVLLAILIVPTIFYSNLACFYAYLRLNRPVNELLKERKEKVFKGKIRDTKDCCFLKEMTYSTLRCKKSLAFFIAFSCFCFSAMVQMSVSMKDMSGAVMRVIILVIGLVLACTTLVMAITSLVKANIKNISLMKAFGYTKSECAGCVLNIYRPVALIGFIVGTVYQYGLLSIMVNIVFKDVAYIIQYSFDLKAMLITFVLFVAFYETVMLLYASKLNKISVKEIMQEN